MPNMLIAALASLALHFAPTPPCTTATTACEQWVTLGGGPGRTMVYASYPLDARNAAITRALIMVHGTGRNADHYFETSMAAAFLAGALENTIVIAPHIIAATDTPRVNEVKWPNGGVSWRAGGMSISHPTLSAFDIADELLRKLSDKKNFPNLSKIVVAGHSAGGQYATRYEMASKVYGTIGNVEVTFVVANPSTYAWPVALRPLPTGHGNPDGADKEALGANQTKVNGDFTFGPFDAAKAPSYNKWPAGLEDRAGYTAG